MQIDLQLNPATTPWPLLRDGVLAAEEAGFGAFWMVDHLAGRSMSGHTMLECFTTLGALAAVTSTIPLGTLVANVHNRTPGVLAVAAATLDQISGRQVLLGLGAGASPTSTFAAEQLAARHTIEPTLAGRHATVERTLDLLDELWSTAPSPDHDRFATFPRPANRPHVILGVNSVALARLAGARTHGVNVRWSDPRAAELLDAARRAADGRPFEETTWATWDRALVEHDHPQRATMRGCGVQRLILAAFEPLSAAEILRAGAAMTVG